MTKIDCGDLQP